MTTPTVANFVRVTGAVHAVAGVLLAAAYLSHHHVMTPETIGSPHWMLVHLAFVGSLLGGIFGVTGLYVGHMDRVSFLGHVGYALAVVGLFLVGGLAYFETFIAPTLAQEFSTVIETYGAGDTMGPVAIMFPLSGTATVVGYAALAAAMLRARLGERRVLWSVLATAILFGIGLSPAGGLHLAMVGGSMFGLALVWIGYRTMRGYAQ